LTDTLAAPAARARRLLYIDWLRGLAVLFMFEAHLYPAWMLPAELSSRAFMWTKVFAGYAAPLFLFLAGVGMAMAMTAALARGKRWEETRRTALKRGFQIFLAALAFRFQCYLLGGGSPANMLRVDILNCIGLSMLISAAWLWPRERGLWAWRAILGAVFVVAITPLAVSFAWPARAWPLTNYLYSASEVIFPLLPWAAYLFAGLAAGILWSRGATTPWVMQATLVAGLGAVAAGFLLSGKRSLHYLFLGGTRREQPGYFISHLGWTGIVAAVGSALQRFAKPERFGPVRQLGRTSLLMYWVHVEIVFGHLAGGYLLNLKGRLSFGEASLALCVLSLAMLLLSWARTHYLGAFRAASLFEHLWAELVGFLRTAWRKSAAARAPRPKDEAPAAD
jgi:uncharacterized membrane protein